MVAFVNEGHSMDRTPQPPLSATSSAWLRDAALQFGTPAIAQAFSAALPAELDGISIAPVLLQEEPVEQWALVAALPRPPGVEEPVWTTLLLHLNPLAMATAPLGIGTDAAGGALAVYRVPSAHTGDASLLAQDLFVLSYFSGLLRECATTVQDHLPAMLDARARHPAPEGDTAAASGAAGLPPLPGAMAAAVHAQLDAGWHRPLLQQAFRALGAEPGGVREVPLAECVRWRGTEVQIVACGDGRTLLLSALLQRSLADMEARLAALAANAELMLIAGCSLGVSPEGTLVQTRWNASGMDGDDLAAQLDGFATLATCMDGA